MTSNWGLSAGSRVSTRRSGDVLRPIGLRVVAGLDPLNPGCDAMQTIEQRDDVGGK